MVTDEHNKNLKAIPTMEELRTVVFLMNPNSAAGPDGMNGQLINRDKSNFMVPSNAFNSTVRRIKKVTGFKQKNSPITYLGCPLYIGRQRIIYYSELIAKVVARIAGWQAKLISYEGRVTLIKHVIQALPIHLLSASSPSATTIKQI
ncbi:uncharacterized protein LOC129894627 [Solanum dulcamara]|uniref:uncharacterized protein LOC129894627 n=1 Tax=Solanum dulcamara TaxID=45834 RepID=UPI002486661A|nr:uncharacterized protein LOC129894627 [Solanum dulcamara]